MRFNKNVQNICKLQSFTYKLHIITMQKSLLLLFLVILFSCEKNDLNDCFGKVYLNETIFLNNSEFNDLIISPGWVTTYKGMRNIIILKNGINNPTYKVFDLECPNHDCTTPMTFDGVFKLTCKCDSSIYSVLDGSPQSNNANCSAYEYNVRVNGDTLIITNY